MSSSQVQANPPSPALIFDTFNAYQRTGALRAAIELDLFTAIDNGAKTAAQIAERTGASEKGTRVLCDFLTVMGFLSKDAAGYALTSDTSFFLSRRSPAYVGSISQFLGQIEHVSGFFDNISGAVRKGGSTLPGDGTVERDNPIWVTFAQTMTPLMFMPSEMIAKMVGAPEGRPSKVLDIAAGHGLFGIAIAKQNPNAHIVAVDWAAVLNVARDNAAKAGVADRFTLLPGSAFEVDFGSDYDIVLLTNFLHHFNVQTCQDLLRKIHRSLKPGGMVATLEFIPNDDRISPPTAATFSMMMLATTPEGDAYTFSEFDSMFRNAGFARSEMRDLSPLPERVVISYK